MFLQSPYVCVSGNAIYNGRCRTYVFGVPELEREIAALDIRCTEWAPREEWSARLSDGIDFRQGTTCEVTCSQLWNDTGD
jgi:hypothetical protein